MLRFQDVVEHVLSKARKDYTDKHGRTWRWNEGLKKYQYVSKNPRGRKVEEVKKPRSKKVEEVKGKRKKKEKEQPKGRKKKDEPLKGKKPKKSEVKGMDRNTKVYTAYQMGGNISEIAEAAGISVARARQIISKMRGELGGEKRKRKAAEEDTGPKIGEYEVRRSAAGVRDSGGPTYKLSAQPYKKDGILISRGDITKLPDANFIPEDLRGSLKNHQADFINLSMQRFEDGEHGMANFDATGTGKTREQLGLAETYMEHHPGETVLICTENTRIIKGSFAKDGAAMKVGMKLVKTADDITGPGIHICRYRDLPKLHKKFGSMGLTLFDESHNMKNSTMSRKARLGLTLAQQSKHCAVFSATPIDKAVHMKYVCSVFNLNYQKTMKFLGYKRERVGKVYAWGRSVDAIEAAGRLDSIFKAFTERGNLVKREVPMDGLGLQLDEVKMDDMYQSRYDAATEKMKKELEFADPNERGLTKARWLMRIRALLEEAKLDHTTDLIKKAVKGGRQVVIFAERVNDSMIKDLESGHLTKFSGGTLNELQKRLTKLGIPFGSVFGSKKKGQSDIKSFQDGKHKVIITTPKSGGTGINLDDTGGKAPRTAIIMTPPFSAVDFVQMLGRVHRLTTKSKSEAHFLNTGTVVDEWNKGIIANKLVTLGGTVKGDYEALSMDDLEKVQHLGQEEATKFLEQRRKDMRAGKTATPYAGPAFNFNDHIEKGPRKAIVLKKKDIAPEGAGAEGPTGGTSIGEDEGALGDEGDILGAEGEEADAEGSDEGEEDDEKPIHKSMTLPLLKALVETAEKIPDDRMLRTDLQEEVADVVEYFVEEIDDA
jgi:hypothetical protein